MEMRRRDFVKIGLLGSVAITVGGVGVLSLYRNNKAYRGHEMAIIDALRAQGEAALQATPGLKHEWLSNENSLVLRVPAISADGFDIELEANTDGLQLRCGGMHTPLVDGPDPATAVRDALGLLRDLLSPAMQLRDMRAGGGAYRWFLEAASGAGWRVEYETGVLAWNFFGRRTQRVYCNRHLPARKQ
jgi:hypothetical protein